MTTPVTQNELIDKVDDLDEDLSSLKLTDLASAGTNITFTTPTIDDFTVVGSPTISSGIASGFSGSNYIYKSGVMNAAYNAESFVFQTKFNVSQMTSDYGGNRITHVKTGAYGDDLFNIVVDNSGRISLKIYSGFSSSSGVVATNTWYWLRVIYTGGEVTSGDYKQADIVLQLSTNGTTFTDIASKHVDNGIIPTSDNFAMGTVPGYAGFRGSIDLTETWFKDSNGNILWAASAPASVPFINVNTLTASSAPVDNTTSGTVGQLYVDTTNKDAYICVESDGSSTYTWKKITP